MWSLKEGDPLWQVLGDLLPGIGGPPRQKWSVMAVISQDRPRSVTLRRAGVSGAIYFLFLILFFSPPVPGSIRWKPNCGKTNSWSICFWMCTEFEGRWRSWQHKWTIQQGLSDWRCAYMSPQKLFLIKTLILWHRFVSFGDLSSGDLGDFNLGDFRFQALPP